MKKFFLILFALSSLQLFPQGRLRSLIPECALNAQFAGSTGFLSGGIFAVTRRNKMEFGLMYGAVPEELGGPNQSLSFKLLYNPFQLHLVKHFFWEPVQVGFFLCQNFNEDLGMQWGSEYPDGYYWWTRSLRMHVFLSSQLSYHFDAPHVDRLAYYFEANTNDLYLYSYIPNRRTMRLYDIIFFGMGLKLYIK